MASELLGWFRTLKAIENDHRVAIIAMNRLSDQAARDPSLLGSGLRHRDVKFALERLNGTYAVRLFAEFETALRAYWTFTRIDAEPNRIAEIIDRIASNRRVDSEILANVHRVRGYRNRQVHDDHEAGEQIDLWDCRNLLSLFLARLPVDWTPHT